MDIAEAAIFFSEMDHRVSKCMQKNVEKMAFDQSLHGPRCLKF